MESLLTPFGEIKILIDGKEVPYLAQKGGNLDGLCQHVLGRYQITVSFIPDGNEHDIACIFEPTCSFKKITESGERLECQVSIMICVLKCLSGLNVKQDISEATEHLMHMIMMLIIWKRNVIPY